MKLEPQIDDLYALPLDAFTNARNALAKTLSGKDKKTIGDLTETYRVLTVDGKLDDKLFEIPAKK